MLDFDKKYYRKNNTVFEFETKLPVICFVQYFPDLVFLSKDCIEYLNKYINHFPNLVYKTDEIQLSLF